MDIDVLMKEKLAERELSKRLVKMQSRLKLVESQLDAENRHQNEMKRQNAATPSEESTRSDNKHVTSRQILESLKNKTKEQEKVKYRPALA